MNNALAGQTVLVTSVSGIHGFIGGRLVEMLARWENVQVRTLLRDFNESPGVARFPVDMVCGDPTDATAVGRAVAGCSMVFNTSHDFDQPDKNVVAARVLAQACLDNGVSRLIHLSSAGVHEPFHDGIVNEDSRLAPCDVDWVQSKRAVESELMGFAGALGLPVAIVQPTHVYGPLAYNGTLRPVHHMKYGKMVLPNSGEGFCNTVYVDDVARALLLAATTDGAVGEKFLISGPDSLTWREFYRAYEAMLGIDGVALRPPDEMWHKGIPRTTTRLFHKAIKIKDVFPFKQLKARLSEHQARALQDFAERGPGTRLYYPDRLSLRLYLTKAQVSYDKATRVLGYTPQFDFARGMYLTERYLRWANLM